MSAKWAVVPRPRQSRAEVRWVFGGYKANSSAAAATCFPTPAAFPSRNVFSKRSVALVEGGGVICSRASCSTIRSSRPKAPFGSAFAAAAACATPSRAAASAALASAAAAASAAVFAAAAALASAAASAAAFAAASASALARALASTLDGPSSSSAPDPPTADVKLRSRFQPKGAAGATAAGAGVTTGDTGWAGATGETGRKRAAGATAGAEVVAGGEDRATRAAGVTRFIRAVVVLGAAGGSAAC